MNRRGCAGGSHPRPFEPGRQLLAVRRRRQLRARKPPATRSTKPTVASPDPFEPVNGNVVGFAAVVVGAGAVVVVDPATVIGTTAITFVSADAWTEDALVAEAVAVFG